MPQRPSATQRTAYLQRILTARAYDVALESALEPARTLSRRLGNGNGGLPFTVRYGRDGQVLQRHIGETRYEQLAAWAKGFS